MRRPGAGSTVSGLKSHGEFDNSPVPVVFFSRRTQQKPCDAIQAIIILSVFCPFAIFYPGEKIRWNHLAAFVCILAAVAFTFVPKE
jgi:hypothetical protein